MPDRAHYHDFNRVVEIGNIQYEDEGTYECIVKRKSSVSTKEVVLSIECTWRLLFQVWIKPSFQFVIDFEGFINT